MLRAGHLKPFDQSVFAGGIAISARNATCEVWATEYTPYGTMADVISERARSVGKLRYVHKGIVYAEPPGLAPLLSLLLRAPLLAAWANLSRLNALLQDWLLE